MNRESHPPQTPTDSTTVTARRVAIGRGVLFGGLVAATLGWTLLSPGLSLPAMLGVFFFMLFGLFIGAVVHRASAAARPIAKATVIWMTAIVSLCAWAPALVKEYVDFPEEFADKAWKQVYIPEGEDAHQKVVAELESFVRKYLNERHPPGGMIGYFQMAASGASITIDQLPTAQPKPVTIARRAAGWVWCTRGVLSLVLGFVAIYAVTVELTRPPKSKKGEGKTAETTSESETTAPPSADEINAALKAGAPSQANQSVDNLRKKNGIPDQQTA